MVEPKQDLLNFTRLCRSFMYQEILCAFNLDLVAGLRASQTMALRGRFPHAI